MSGIDPQAVVEPGATIGRGVTIEPFAVVKGSVCLEDRVTIKSHAYIDGNTTIGEGTTVWPGAVIGTQTQDLKYQGEKTFVKIGRECQIREFVTINSSCHEGSVVSVGDGCLIMTSVHIAHNCSVGEGVILSNGVMLAGYVTVEDFAIIGGMTPVHQHSRIGKGAMVGGFSRVSHDVPPYTLGAGVPYKMGGLNLIGLKRREMPYEIRRDLTKAFKWTYRSQLRLEEALAKVEKELNMDEPAIAHWVHFCRTSKRGLIGLEGVAHKEVPEKKELVDTLEPLD